MDTLIDRLEYLKLHKIISFNGLAKIMGYNNGYITQLKKSNSSPSVEGIARLLAHYKDINPDWLILGIGSMFRKQPIENIPQSIDVGPVLELHYEQHPEKDPKFHSTGPMAITIDRSGNENILLVNSKAQAGYAHYNTDPEYLATMKTFSIPIMELAFATHRCFQIAGRSMEPTFQNNDWVIGRYLDNWPSAIKNGALYIIVTTTTVLIKRVFNLLKDKGQILIKSDNEEFLPDYIYASDIREIWIAKARLSFHFPEPSKDLTMQVEDLEIKLIELTAKLDRLEERFDTE